MTAEMKKLKNEVKTLKREVKQLRVLLTKATNQLERTTIVAATASSSATETKKKLSSLMRDPAVQVPQKLERKVEALNRAHANTRAFAERTESDVSRLHNAVQTVNKDFRDDVLKSLRGFEARLDEVESITQVTSQVVDEVVDHNVSLVKPHGVDANGSTVEPEQLTLDDARTTAGEATGIPGGAS